MPTYFSLVEVKACGALDDELWWLISNLLYSERHDFTVVTPDSLMLLLQKKIADYTIQMALANKTQNIFKQ